MTLTGTRVNVGALAKRAEARAGLAYARAWRERMRPIFDDYYGVHRWAKH